MPTRAGGRKYITMSKKMGSMSTKTRMAYVGRKATVSPELSGARASLDAATKAKADADKAATKAKKLAEKCKKELAKQEQYLKDAQEGKGMWCASTRERATTMLL